MTYKEKVIKGLEEISDYLFGVYHYSKDREEINKAKDWRDVVEDAIALLKNPDRIKVTRCKDCRFFEPCNVEEGDNSGHCRNDCAPCQNQTVDAWWFCGSAERVSE